MNQLSFTESFVLCLVNRHDKESALFDNTYEACILAAALWELIDLDALEQDEKKQLRIKGIPDTNKAYLLELQRHIAELKPQTAMRIVEHYVFGISSKRTKTLVGLIIEDLVELGQLTVETHKGIIKDKHKYHSEQVTVDGIISHLKEQLLKDEPLSHSDVDEETLILSALLYESHLLHDYLSKIELERLKKRINEIKDSREGQFVKEIIDDIEAMMVAIMVTTNSGLY